MPPPENSQSDRANGQTTPPRLRPNFPVDRQMRRPIGDVRIPPRNARDNNRPSYHEQPPAPPSSVAAIDETAPSFAQPPALTQHVSLSPTVENANPPQFIPKPKRHLKLPSIKIIGAVVLLVLLIGAVILFFVAQAARNNPNRVFNDALTHAMTTSSVQIDSVKKNLKSQTLLDLNDSKSISSSAMATIQMDGAPFDLKSYGTTHNSYISYQKIPASVSTKVSSAVLGGWVQLRGNDLQAPGIPAALVSLADPYSSAFGPLTFGNFNAKTRQQLLGYISAQHIYAYDAKQVTSTRVRGVKVRAYKVKLNTGYLKIIAQSAANAQGVKTTDMTAAVAALDSFKGANITIYVNSHSHTFQQLTASLNGGNTTISYSHINSSQVTGEPQTKLTWHDFAPVQWQLEAEAATIQPPSVLDNIRQADLASLHPLLAQYFAQNNSYPTLANLNDQNWVATNFHASDPEIFRDPLGVKLVLSGSPSAATYSYQVTGSNPKAACTGGVDNACLHYRLTAILSTKQQFVIQDP